MGWFQTLMANSVGSGGIAIGGIEIGSQGAAGSLYEGYKLDFGDDFNALPDFWTGSNLGGKYSSSRPQSFARRIDSAANRMMYVDEHWRGGRSESPTDLNVTTMSVSGSLLNITAQAPDSSIVPYLPTTYTQGGGDAGKKPPLISGAIRTWPSYMWSAEGNFIYEGKMRFTSGVKRGWWPSLWSAGLNWSYFGEIDMIEAKKDASGNVTNWMNLHTAATSGGTNDAVQIAKASMPTDRLVWVVVKKIGTTLTFYDDAATEGTLAQRATYTDAMVGRLKGSHDIRLEFAVDNGWDSSIFNPADWPATVSYDWFRVWTPTGTPTPTAMNVLGQVNTAPGGAWSFTIPSNSVLFGSDYTPNIIDATAAFDNTDTPGYLTAANRLPGGMTVDLTARTITGTVPTTEGGRVGVLFTASSAGGGAARRAIQYFNVAPAVQSVFKNQEVLYAGAVNLTIGYTAFHSGNLGPHTYTVTKTGGSWLTIAGNGTASVTITGTAPSADETVTLTIACTNSIGQVTTEVRTLTIAASFAYNPVTDIAVLDFWTADDASTVFSDFAATTPATDTGIVRAWIGKKAGYKWGNANTSSNLIVPVWQSDSNGKKILKFTRANVSRLVNEDAALIGAVDGTNDPYTLTMRLRRGDAGVSSTPLSFCKMTYTTKYIRHFVTGSNLPGVSRLGTSQVDCIAPAGNEITTDDWLTLTYVFNGATGVLRINGVQKQSVTQSGAGAIEIELLVLGALYETTPGAYNAANAFNGTIGGIIISEFTSLSDPNIAAREAYLETLFPS